MFIHSDMLMNDVVERKCERQEGYFLSEWILVFVADN